MIEGKEGKERIKPPKSPKGDVSLSDQISEVIAHYQSLYPRTRAGEKERKLIGARLKDQFTVEDLKLAIDGNNQSPFHSGCNDSGKKYHGLSLIFRDADKVNGFIASATGADIRRGPDMPTLAQVQEAYGHVEE